MKIVPRILLQTPIMYEDLYMRLGRAWFQEAPRVFNFPRLPQLPPPTHEQPGWPGLPFVVSRRPCLLHHRRRYLLFSLSLFVKFTFSQEGIRHCAERACPADHCALSREGASRPSPYTTAPHTFTYRRQANRPAEPLHSPPRSHPSSRTLLSRHTSPVGS